MKNIGDENRDTQSPQEKPDETSHCETQQPEQPAAQPDTEKVSDPPPGETQPATEQPSITAGRESPPERKSPAKNFTKREGIIIAVIGILLSLATIFWVQWGDQEWGGFQPGEAVYLSPRIYDETGIAPNTPFVVAFPGVTSLERARELVGIEPPHAFDIFEADTFLTDLTGEFIIIPRTPFERNSQITITAAGQQFEFTVRNELLITGVFPADGAQGVPVGSSIVLTVNSVHEVIDLFDSMAVFRSRDGHYEDFRVLPQEGREIHITPTYPLRPDTVYNIVISPPLEDAAGARLLQPFEFSFTTAPDDGMLAPHSRLPHFELAGGATTVNVIDGDALMLPATVGGATALRLWDFSATVRAFDG